MSDIKKISEAYLEMKKTDASLNEATGNIEPKIAEAKKQILAAEKAMNEFIRLGKIAHESSKYLYDNKYKVEEKDKRAIEDFLDSKEYEMYSKFNKSNKIS